MATPMHVYDRIARRFGATTPAQVDRFFEVEILKLPVAQQRALLSDLLAANGESAEKTLRGAVTFVPPSPIDPPPCRAEDRLALDLEDAALRQLAEADDGLSGVARVKACLTTKR